MRLRCARRRRSLRRRAGRFCILHERQGCRLGTYDSALLRSEGMRGVTLLQAASSSRGRAQDIVALQSSQARGRGGDRVGIVTDL